VFIIFATNTRIGIPDQWAPVLYIVAMTSSTLNLTGHVELDRFLARREVLERSHENTPELIDGCHRKGAAFK